MANIEPLTLAGSRCEAVSSDIRLHSPKFEYFTYPDVVVVCGEPMFLDIRKDTITDATLVTEVLSPSTKSYDRGDKFAYYRSLPSFSEYLLLSQDQILAEHRVRRPDGTWLFREHTSASDVIELTSIGCRVSIGALYQRVDFEPKS